MLLISVSSIRTSLGFDDVADINAAIESTLKTSTQSVASSLRTGFGRGSRTDYFYATAPYTIGTFAQLYLLLDQGFVDSSENVTIKIAPTIEKFGTSEEEDITTNCLVNYEKGVVHISGKNFYNQVIKVEYIAGFNLDDQEVTQYDPDEVPEWLKNIAKMETLITLALTREDLWHSEGKFTTTELRTRLLDQLSRYTRYEPKALNPIFSV